MPVLFQSVVGYGMMRKYDFFCHISPHEVGSKLQKAVSSKPSHLLPLTVCCRARCRFSRCAAACCQWWPRGSWPPSRWQRTSPVSRWSPTWRGRGPASRRGTRCRPAGGRSTAVSGRCSPCSPERKREMHLFCSHGWMDRHRFRERIVLRIRLCSKAFFLISVTCNNAGYWNYRLQHSWRHADISQLSPLTSTPRDNSQRQHRTENKTPAHVVVLKLTRSANPFSPQVITYRHFVMWCSCLFHRCMVSFGFGDVLNPPSHKSGPVASVNDALSVQAKIGLLSNGV